MDWIYAALFSNLPFFFFYHFNLEVALHIGIQYDNPSSTMTSLSKMTFQVTKRLNNHFLSSKPIGSVCLWRGWILERQITIKSFSFKVRHHSARHWLCLSFIFTLPLFAWEKATRGQAIKEDTLAVARVSHHWKLQQKIKRQLIWGRRGNQVYSHDNLHRSSINISDEHNYLQLHILAKYKRISKSCLEDGVRIETITKTNKR